METECDGGGSQTCVTPAAAMSSSGHRGGRWGRGAVAPIWIGGGCRGEGRNRGGEWGVRLGFLGVGACVGQGWGLGRPGGVAGWAGWVGPVGPRPRGVSLFFLLLFCLFPFSFIYFSFLFYLV